jgi:hypothetical protein
MLPPELRLTAVSHAWNDLRLQWRLPFALLASSDSSLSSTSCAPPRPLWRNVPPRRYNHAIAKQTAPLTKQDPRVFPDSLHDTLEAHRDANRATLIHRLLTKHVDSPPDGTSQPDLGPNVQNGSGNDGEDARQEIDQGDARGSPTNSKIKPNSPKQFAADYEGRNQQPSKEWELPTWGAADYMKRPWLAYLENFRKPADAAHEYLTAEILAFDDYMEPTISEKSAVEEALADVRRAVASLDPAIKVSVIGSRGTGVAMPLSDIDINLERPNHLHYKKPGQRLPSHYDLELRVEIIDLLRMLTKRLRKKGGPKKLFYESILIDAKVPIVHARHAQTDLEIQIQSTTNCLAGMQMVLAYVEEYPTLRPLFRVLRQVLKMRGLGEPKANGIGSYPLIMMIIATLKFSGARFDRRDAARQLLYFLDFYSTIDFKTFGIAVDPPELFSKLSTGPDRAQSIMMADDADGLLADELGTDQVDTTRVDASRGRARVSETFPTRPYLMSLQDPVNPHNNLGNSAAAIKHCQATFANLRQRIKISMDRFEPGGSVKGRASLLEPCLAGNYHDFYRKRMALQRAGKKATEPPQVAKYL